jgi:hypothetical protein
MILLYFFGYCRKIIILCHSYQIITFVPRYTILFPMVYRICMFCFFMDSIFLRMNFLILVVIHGRLTFCTVINLLGIVLSTIFKIVFAIMSTIVSTSLSPDKISQSTCVSCCLYESKSPMS